MAADGSTFAWLARSHIYLPGGGNPSPSMIRYRVVLSDFKKGEAGFEFALSLSLAPRFCHTKPKQSMFLAPD